MGFLYVQRSMPMVGTPMKNFHDIPDLPEMAFRRGPNGSIKPQGGGGKGSTPKQPDYIGAAQATSQGNLDLAKYATQANRVNQVTPYGSLTWSNGRTFDQAGYDAAMNAYRNSLASQGQASAPSSGYGGDNRYVMTYDGTGSDQDSGKSMLANYLSGNRQSGSQSQLAAPDINSFYSGGDNWTQTVQLSPEMQAMFDQNMKVSQGLFGSQDAALGRVQQMMGSGFDTSNLPAAGTALDINGLPAAGSVYDPNQATNTATEAILSRVNPELDRQYESLRGQLANQGIAQGSAAWNNAMGSFGQQRNDAVTQAGLQGINLGMQQQGQTYGQQTQNRSLAAALQGQQFGQANTARGNALQEQAYLRSLPLNELNALRNGTQVQMPEFSGYAQQATTGGADILGATQAGYQSALGASNAQNAAAQQQGSGLGGLAGAGLGYFLGGPMGGMLGSGVGGALGGLFSDRRLKTNIKRVGVAENGLAIYSYNYIWGGPAVLGHMADEVEKVAPGAVGDVGGLKTVDYARI